MYQSNFDVKVPIFIKNWEKITNLFTRHKGQLGSSGWCNILFTIIDIPLQNKSHIFTVAPPWHLRTYKLLDKSFLMISTRSKYWYLENWIYLKGFKHKIMPQYLTLNLLSLKHHFQYFFWSVNLHGRLRHLTFWGFEMPKHKIISFYLIYWKYIQTK